MSPDITVEHLKALSSFSTPEISDALDACEIKGYLQGILPISKAPKAIGFAYTIQYEPYEASPNTFAQASQYIDEVPAHAMILIDNHGSKECSVWGGILTHYAHHHHIAGTVVHGMVRDKQMIDQYNYPIFAKGLTPQTGKNRAKMVDSKCTLTIQGVQIKYQDILFADDNGVLVIPREHFFKILTMVQNISDNEAQIIKAIDSGKTLKEAREMYNYSQPWKK